MSLTDERLRRQEQREREFERDINERGDEYRPPIREAWRCNGLIGAEHEFTRGRDGSRRCLHCGKSREQCGL